MIGNEDYEDYKMYGEVNGGTLPGCGIDKQTYINGDNKQWQTVDSIESLK